MRRWTQPATIRQNCRGALSRASPSSRWSDIGEVPPGEHPGEVSSPSLLACGPRKDGGQIPVAGPGYPGLAGRLSRLRPDRYHRPGGQAWRRVLDAAGPGGLGVECGAFAWERGDTASTRSGFEVAAMRRWTQPATIRQNCRGALSRASPSSRWSDIGEVPPGEHPGEVSSPSLLACGPRKDGGQIPVAGPGYPGLAGRLSRLWPDRYRRPGGQAWRRVLDAAGPGGLGVERGDATSTRQNCRGEVSSPTLHGMRGCCPW